MHCITIAPFHRALQVPSGASSSMRDTISAASQKADPYLYLPISFSFVPGLSASAIAQSLSGKKIATMLSFNVLVGWSDKLAGVEGSGIWGAHSDDSFGVQGAGIGNSIGGSFRGAQSAGIINVVNGSFEGAQGAGIVNIVNKRFYGVQGAGVINIVDNKFDGVQGAGIINITGGATSGIQVAGIGNFSGGAMSGIQLAGIVNTASSMDGLHIGLLNIADGGDGVPIGLVSIIHNVGVEAELWGDNLGFGYLVLRTGTRTFANYFGIARRFSAINTNLLTASSFFEEFGVTYGLGIEYRFTRALYWTLDTFITGLLKTQTPLSTVFSSETLELAGISTLRSTLALEIFPGFGVFGGAALNFFVSEYSTGSDFIRWSLYDAQVGRTAFRIAPSLVFGIRLF